MMKVMRVRGCPLLAVLVALAGTVTGSAQERTDGAKALFYSPGTGTASPREKKTIASRPQPLTKRRRVSPVPSGQAQSVGVNYWLELLGVGRVTDTRTFRTGDRVRLHVRSNVAGYLTIWSFNAAGQSQLLVPTSGAANRANIEANSPYISPVIKFSLPAQDERLVLSFSRTKLGSSPDAPTVGGPSEVLAGALGASGARALVVEVDDQNPSEFGTYVVNKEGGPVATEIRLRHETR